MPLSSPCSKNSPRSPARNPSNTSRTSSEPSMTISNDSDLKNRTLNKIRFLEDQLMSLDYHMPETYQYLVHELDLQKRIQAELEVQEHFDHIDQHENPHDPSNHAPQIQNP